MTCALFESWRGRYSDSPRAISEELAVRRPDIEQHWVAAPGTELPPTVRPVRRHSPEYFWRLLRADLLVCNDIVSRHVLKGRRVHYLQTWHGTPLKAIGYDEVDPKYAGAAAHLKRMRRDVAKWDQLISPSPECTGLLRSAFRYGGEVVESGYPRNDLLCSPERDRISAEVRERLGLASTGRVVLYAPTWRDDRRDELGRYADPGGLDVEEFLRSTDDDVTLMVRMHSVVGSWRGRPDDRVLDVSAYPEIAELYLAADALVTDYSSAAFDFAVTRRPIIFFAYDLEHYQRLRPFYFDYEEWAPGPVVRTTGELCEAIGELVRMPGAPRADWPWPNYAEFVQRFCPFDDGGASGRAVDALLVQLDR